MICNMQLLAEELAADEGRRNKRYKCTANKWTIGIGHNLEGKKFPPDIWLAICEEHPHLTNALLDDATELSDALIDRIFRADVDDAIADLDAIWIGWRDLSENRKRALINWSFQCGRNTMLQFKRFWNSMRAHDFEQAANGLEDSLWFKQTQPSRRSRVVRQIREG